MLRDLAQCRTAALGGHLEQCASCGTPRPVYNSCRNRHCPKCESLAQAAWRDAQQALLLPIPYFHLVFTVPHELNALMRANPRRCYAILFQAVAATLKTFARDPRHLGAEIGVTPCSTRGRRRSSITSISIASSPAAASGSTAPLAAQQGRRYLFPVAAMAALFRGKFLARLVAAHRRGGSSAPGRAPRSRIRLAWQQLLASAPHQSLVRLRQGAFAGPKQVLNYLARYTHRIAISNERILGVEDDQVRFRYKDYAAGSVMKEMRVDARSFSAASSSTSSRAASCASATTACSPTAIVPYVSRAAGALLRRAPATRRSRRSRRRRPSASCSSPASTSSAAPCAARDRCAAPSGSPRTHHDRRTARPPTCTSAASHHTPACRASGSVRPPLADRPTAVRPPWSDLTDSLRRAHCEIERRNQLQATLRARASLPLRPLQSP